MALERLAGGGEGPEQDRHKKPHRRDLGDLRGRGRLPEERAIEQRLSDRAGEAPAAMRRPTEGHAPPADACHTYRAVLAELEADLHHHIHKENNILFPRALEAEARLA